MCETLRAVCASNVAAAGDATAAGSAVPANTEVSSEARGISASQANWSYLHALLAAQEHVTFKDVVVGLRDAERLWERRDAQAWVARCAAPALRLMVGFGKEVNAAYLANYADAPAAFMRYMSAAVVGAATSGMPALDGLAEALELILNSKAAFYSYMPYNVS